MKTLKLAVALGVFAGVSHFLSGADAKKNLKVNVRVIDHHQFGKSKYVVCGAGLDDTAAIKTEKAESNDDCLYKCSYAAPCTAATWNKDGTCTLYELEETTGKTFPELSYDARTMTTFWLDHASAKSLKEVSFSVENAYIPVYEITYFFGGEASNCAWGCHQTEKCWAYTWVPPEEGETSGSCSLKARGSTPVDAEGAISGVILRQETNGSCVL